MPKKSFPIDEVEIDIPAQPGKRAKAKKFPLGSDYPSSPGFSPTRLVINLGVVDADQEDAVIEYFDPPIKLTIRYKKSDYEDAREQLKLAFWDGKQWVPFEKEKHGYTLIEDIDGKPENGGKAVVTLSNWGDPPIAWGN